MIAGTRSFPSRRSRVRFLAAACVALISGHALAKHPRAEFSVRTELGYDSNPLLYTDAQLVELRQSPGSPRYALTSPDDVWVSPVSPRLSVRNAVRLLDAPGRLGIEGSARLYRANGILNYAEFEPFAVFGRLTLSDTFTPRRYRRQYRNPTTYAYESAFYSQHWFSARVRTKPVEWLTVRPRLRLRLRRFEAPFGSRDSTNLYAGARADFEITRILRPSFEYEIVSSSADGGPGQHDRSYVEHRVAPGVRVTPIPPLSLEAHYRVALRAYTTNAAPAIDPTYRDRHDDERDFELSVRWEPLRNLGVGAETVQSSSRASVPHDVTATEDETTWHRSEYRVFVEVGF